MSRNSTTPDFSKLTFLHIRKSSDTTYKMRTTIKNSLEEFICHTVPNELKVGAKQADSAPLRMGAFELLQPGLHIPYHSNFAATSDWHK
ncbi:hypothetical protein HAX54_010538 [Datura stramonium]|uniref:Uncharacterized protein n=1 Tax=Datura stramonium TaxID=4076 RepID=A0ABS8TI73_DATST|nr:hypothetical protein [Datura stramonium]